MATMNKVTPRSIWVGRLDHGADLLEEITTVCKDNNIRLGKIEAIGAVKKATLGYYDQKTMAYGFFELDRPLEITSLVGNVSIKDGEPMVHAHVTLADHDGTVMGGHLAPGTIIFACEATIQELEGEELVRGMDEATQLPLWDM